MGYQPHSQPCWSGFPSTSKAVWSPREGKFLLDSWWKLGSWSFTGQKRQPPSLGAAPWSLPEASDLVRVPACLRLLHALCANVKWIHRPLGVTSAASSTSVPVFLWPWDSWAQPQVLLLAYCDNPELLKGKRRRGQASGYGKPGALSREWFLPYSQETLVSTWQLVVTMLEDITSI